MWDRKRNGEVVTLDSSKDDQQQLVLISSWIQEAAHKNGIKIGRYDLVPVAFVEYMKHVIPSLVDTLIDYKRPQLQKDIICYLSIKAMEYQTAYQVYAPSDRHEIMDVFVSPDEIGESVFRTNLPHHLEERVKSQFSTIRAFAESIVTSHAFASRDFFEKTLMECVKAAFSYAKQLCISKARIGSYSNSEMLTLNEIRYYGISTLAEILNKQGYAIMQVSPMLDAYISVKMKKDNQLIYVFADVQVAPVRNHFLPRELETLSRVAYIDKAKPYYACISIGSDNQTHLQDGVLLIDDRVMVRINALEQLHEQISR